MPNAAPTITGEGGRARLTVVVPATDAPPTLGRCLAAIDAAADTPEEVLTVDGPAGAGPAAARNEGWRAASGEIVCFVDADVEVAPDAFTRIRASFEHTPEVAALFGSYDDAPAAAGVVSQFRNLLHHHVHHSSPGPATTFWAGLGAVRRAVLAEAGGFDADRFPRASVEDIELGRRLAAAGRRVELDPEVRGRHLKRWTLRSMVATDFGRRGVPWVRLELERARAGRSGDAGDGGLDGDGPAGGARRWAGTGGQPSGAALNLGPRHQLSALASVVGTVAAARGRRAALAVAVLALLALNRSFYMLLARRLGPRAALGPPLHALHHLTAVAAVPVGALAHLLDRRRGQP